MTPNRLYPFIFEGEVTLRTFERDNVPWFVAADACRGIGVQSASRALESLDEDEKGVSSIHTPEGTQEMLVISESGLFALIMRSRDATTPGTVAHRFRRWVTSEVLPALRRNGSYTAMTSNTAVIEMPKPWNQRSLEERRVDLSEINTARRVFNDGTAAWLWVHLGLPIPPKHLLPAWWQASLVPLPSHAVM